jgi:hypothetical protein
MKAYRGSGCIAQLIIWPRHYMKMSGQLHSPTALPTTKRVLGTRRLGGPQSRSVRGGGEEKNSQQQWTMPSIIAL